MPSFSALLNVIPPIPLDALGRPLKIEVIVDETVSNLGAPLRPQAPSLLNRLGEKALTGRVSDAPAPIPTYVSRWSSFIAKDDPGPDMLHAFFPDNHGRDRIPRVLFLHLHWLQLQRLQSGAIRKVLRESRSSTSKSREISWTRRWKTIVRLRR